MMEHSQWGMLAGYATASLLSGFAAVGLGSLVSK